VRGAPRRLLIHIHPRSGTSLQTQIYNAIRKAVLEGVLAPGTKLISSRALAADLGVSRTTTLLAFEQLTAEGYLETHQRSGTFVSQELPEHSSQQRLSRAAPRLNHPPLSRRGMALIATRPAADRIGGPPRAFRIGVPALDLFPLQTWTRLVNRRLRSAGVKHLDYGDSRGFKALREAIADHVRTARGSHCTADQIVIVAGAQRGLEFIARLLLDAGDHAWMEEPGYTGVTSALISAGAHILKAPVDQHGIDVNVIAQGPGARMVCVTPSHQFPLGVRMSLSRRLALLEWARNAHAWVLEDDYDSEFRYGVRAIPCLHALDPDGRVIFVGSFSKTLFPALRLGFLIVPTDLQESIRSARRAADLHPPVFDQAVLADLMLNGHYDRHLRRMQSAYTERLEALTESLVKYCDGALRLRTVQAGLHAVADLIGVNADKVSAEAAARGVEVMALSAYYTDPETAANGLVLGFASIDPRSIARGAQSLAAAIEAAQHTRSGD
jgi:GntR family transcriptional regulator/MocR family aminotransferase